MSERADNGSAGGGERGLIWLSLSAVVAIAILIALGFWQWERMHWKEALLADLAAAANADPVRMNVLPARERLEGGATAAQDLDELRFKRVTVKGAFEHAREMHVWRPQPGGAAWSVVTPLRIVQAPSREAGLGGRAATHVLVIRGIVPERMKNRDERPGGQPAGEVEVTGRIRLSAPNPWASDPNIDQNQWYARDLDAMAQHLRSSMGEDVAFAPFFVEAETPTGDEAAPKPRLQALTLSNRHLEYALTWWGLAATLAAVYGVFVWGRIRPRRQR